MSWASMLSLRRYEYVSVLAEQPKFLERSKPRASLLLRERVCICCIRTEGAVLHTPGRLMTGSGEGMRVSHQTILSYGPFRSLRSWMRTTTLNIHTPHTYPGTIRSKLHNYLGLNYNASQISVAARRERTCRATFVQTHMAPWTEIKRMLVTHSKFSPN